MSRSSQQPSINLQARSGALYIDAAAVASPADVPPGTSVLTIDPAAAYTIDLQDAVDGVKGGDQITVINTGAGALTVNQGAVGAGSVAAGSVGVFVASISAAGLLTWVQSV